MISLTRVTGGAQRDRKGGAQSFLHPRLRSSAFAFIVGSITARALSPETGCDDTVAYPNSRVRDRTATSLILSAWPNQFARRKKTARVLSSRLVYRGPVFWVTSERVLEPSGVRVLREVVRHTGSVVVLATVEDRREPLVLLERQYRHAAESYLWELAGGAHR